MTARTRFVIVGAKASASPDFRLDDLPGTSGRLDVLLRCVRAALLVSHGVRRDVVVYLVLLGGPAAPRCVRVTGAEVRFLRPDERSLATLVKKSLAAPREGAGFVTVRPGIAVADGGLDAALDDLGDGALWLLDEGGDDLRGAALEGDARAFIVGDHTGFDAATLGRLDERAVRRVAIGPVSVHADDVVAIVTNELDRRRG
jgi:tRNA (pseudouridine54-N1)-methyltransferase